MNQFQHNVKIIEPQTTVTFFVKVKKGKIKKSKTNKKQMTNQLELDQFNWNVKVAVLMEDEKSTYTNVLQCR